MKNIKNTERKAERIEEMKKSVLFISVNVYWAGIATRYGLDGPGIEYRCG